MTAGALYTLLAARLAQITTANGYTTNAGANVRLGVRELEEGAALPLLVINELDTDITRRACATHEVAAEVVVEGHFACTVADTLTPGHALLRDIQRALTPAGCDFTFGGVLIDLAVKGRRVMARESGARTGTCQLLLAVRFNEDF